MTHIDLFSGIGGFALAAQWVWGEAYETLAFVEIDGFCQKALRKNFPNVRIHDDIRTFPFEPLRVRCDLLTGGFPCQPFSIAGKRKGQRDDRFLWKEMLRIIQEYRPRWIVGENVAGIVNLGLDEVLSDLESADYAAKTFIIPACAVNAPHKRERVWIVAHSDHQPTANKIQAGREVVTRLPVNADTDGERRESSAEKSVSRERWVSAQPFGMGETFARVPDVTEPALCGANNGLSGRLDRRRLKALGNAIVPQVAAAIFKAIRAIDSHTDGERREASAESQI